MLFAKENKAERTLMLHCESCQHEQPADDKCVFRNTMTLSASRLFNFQDVASDPTLPRANDVECARCHHNEAVFMKDPVSKDSEGLTLHFICTNCKHNWKPGTRRAAQTILARPVLPANRVRRGFAPCVPCARSPHAQTFWALGEHSDDTASYLGSSPVRSGAAIRREVLVSERRFDRRAQEHDAQRSCGGIGGEGNGRAR